MGRNILEKILTGQKKKSCPFLSRSPKKTPGMFTNMLEYKTIFTGKQLVKIDKFFPSSKTCSFCGAIKTDLKLSDRTYYCDCCNNSIDRDLNAAINIKNEGSKLLEY